MLGNAGIPAGTSANLDWDFKATLLTVAGEYRLRTVGNTVALVLSGGGAPLRELLARNVRYGH